MTADSGPSEPVSGTARLDRFAEDLYVGKEYEDADGRLLTVQAIRTGDPLGREVRGRVTFREANDGGVWNVSREYATDMKTFNAVWLRAGVAEPMVLTYVRAGVGPADVRAEMERLADVGRKRLEEHDAIVRGWRARKLRESVPRPVSPEEDV